MNRLLIALAALPLLAAAPIDRAITADPPRDAAHPARMEVLHIRSGGVAINGVAYIPSGKGPHPVLILAHGLPGNEKNLDVAQAVRRAGWTVVTFNYRGSWGSPGRFAFHNVLEDTGAVIAYVRNPANARRIGANPRKIVLGGHSMGGWATALTAARDPGLAGAILISAADLGSFPRDGRASVTTEMANNAESLAATPQAMADELMRSPAELSLSRAAPGLARVPVLDLSSDDGLGVGTAALGARLRKAGGRVTAVHVATDHSWSDARIRLQSEIIAWLKALR